MVSEFVTTCFHQPNPSQPYGDTHLRLQKHLQSRCWWRISDPSGAPCPQFSLCSGIAVCPCVFQHFVQLKQIVCLSPSIYTETLSALLPEGDQSHTQSSQNSSKERQKSHFCIRSSWGVDLFYYCMPCSIPYRKYLHAPVLILLEETSQHNKLLDAPSSSSYVWKSAI